MAPSSQNASSNSPQQVDELYNHRTRLVCSAAAPPDALFAGADHSEPIIDLESLQVRCQCTAIYR